MARTKKTKRTISPEHLAKLQEGRKKAQEAKKNQVKTKERVAMLSDLDKQLAEGRHKAEMANNMRFPHKRRRHSR